MLEEVEMLGKEIIETIGIRKGERQKDLNFPGKDSDTTE